MKLEGRLPIGSVVLLENSNKRLMVIGYLQKVDEQKVWDYAGVPYPEGFLRAEHTYLFDHSQIRRVYAIGYQDEEQFAFSVQLEKLDRPEAQQ